ncbi:hypothetical protein [Thaumasiovibrio subtropicus]|uniref:hypothetical protein n=1 Tax=Thaumasiovibrio subtropicus TaxID=1891207 RepID=UPI00131AA967|nr:hypothetical protein [Thaumasiovibrio subtropicus]
MGPVWFSMKGMQLGKNVAQLEFPYFRGLASDQVESEHCTDEELSIGITTTDANERIEALLDLAFNNLRVDWGQAPVVVLMPRHLSKIKTNVISHLKDYIPSLSEALPHKIVALGRVSFFWSIKHIEACLESYPLVWVVGIDTNEFFLTGKVSCSSRPTESILVVKIEKSPNGVSIDWTHNDIATNKEQHPIVAKRLIDTAASRFKPNDVLRAIYHPYFVGPKTFSLWGAGMSSISPYVSLSTSYLSLEHDFGDLGPNLPLMELLDLQRNFLSLKYHSHHNVMLFNGTEDGFASCMNVSYK